MKFKARVRLCCNALVILLARVGTPSMHHINIAGSLKKTTSKWTEDDMKQLEKTLSFVQACSRLTKNSVAEETTLFIKIFGWIWGHLSSISITFLSYKASVIGLWSISVYKRWFFGTLTWYKYLFHTGRNLGFFLLLIKRRKPFIWWKIENNSQEQMYSILPST